MKKEESITDERGNWWSTMSAFSGGAGLEEDERAFPALSIRYIKAS